MCMTNRPGVTPRDMARRRLLTYLGSAGGLLLLDPLGLRSSLVSAAVGGGERRWSDPATWGGRVPGAQDVAVVTGNVLLDTSASVRGVVIEPGATLTFDPAQSLTLTSTGNVVVRGTLTMRPPQSSVHTVLFSAVDEGRFVGGGMDPVDSDTGMWVMDDGRLDLVGAGKTAWGRIVGDAAQGATTIRLDRPPAGWSPGDRLVVVPSGAPAAGRNANWWSQFSEAGVRGVSGTAVTLDAPLANAHPSAAGTWGAEVLNLTRNVRIEGTATGRTHVFVRSRAPQELSHASLRHVGPRKGGQKVLGRWGLHFHHCMDASSGATLDGVVITDAGSHAFVPHTSNGMTLRNCIAYRVQEHAFWWDEGELTSGAVWEDCVAALVTTSERSTSGFYLGKGDGNAIRRCVAVGVDAIEGAGIIAPAQVSNGVWTMEDLLAHNNRHGGFLAYLNTDKVDRKVVSRLAAYHNDFGIDHGAYLNSWRYEGFTLYRNRSGGVLLRAVSNSDGIRFVGGTVDQAGAAAYGIVHDRHVVDSAYPTVFEACTFRGHTAAAIGLPMPVPKADVIDLLNCTFVGNELWIGRDVSPATAVRFQDAAHGTICARRLGSRGAPKPQWNAAVEATQPFA
jgi:hypothetical protein